MSNYFRSLCAAVLVIALFGRADAATRTVVIEGTITGADHETYKEIAFKAPVGVERMTISFSYEGRDQKTVIDLGLYDPNGFRGWSGGNKTTITLATNDATPSYRPGPITPGTWRLLLGVPNIRQGVVAPYRAVVTMQMRGEPDMDGFLTEAVSQSPGWRRGDFHTHTAHSDGSCDSLAGRRVPCPAFRTIEAARRAGLDFVAVTDHNTASHFGVLRELQNYYDTTVVIPGREITTFYGHVNVFGSTAPLNFQLGGPRLRDLNTFFDEAEAQGAIVSINHPGAPSGEVCMGCGWTRTDLDPARLSAVEIVNGGSIAASGSAEGKLNHLVFWESLLDRGFHVTGIAGSDNHDADAGPPRQSPVGRPATVVYAQELSQRGLLDGVRSGRVFIDLTGGHKAVLDLRAESAEGVAVMGGTVRLRAGEIGKISVHVANMREGRLELVAGAGAPPGTAGVARVVDSQEGQFVYDISVSDRAYWIRAQVRDALGALLLISNPIYVAPR